MEKLRNRANKLMKTEIALYDQELADPLPQPPCAYVKRRPPPLDIGQLEKIANFDKPTIESGNCLV